MMYGLLLWAFLTRTVDRETAGYLAAFLLTGHIAEDWARRGLLPAARWFAAELWRYRIPILGALVVTENVVPFVFGPIYCAGLFPARNYTPENLTDIWTNTAEAYSVLLYALLGCWAWRGVRVSGGLLFSHLQSARQVVRAALK